MRHCHRLLLAALLVSIHLFSGCSSPLIKTVPEQFTDTDSITITADSRQGNKGLLDYDGPVFVHLGLITDSSLGLYDWRYVKFRWGSTEATAQTIPAGNNKWSYKIPGIRRFFDVKDNEKILRLAVLFRAGNCIDTFCKVLRNNDKSDILLAVNETK